MYMVTTDGNNVRVMPTTVGIRENASNFYIRYVHYVNKQSFSVTEQPERKGRNGLYFAR
jgi:hypothetical protein